MGRSRARISAVLSFMDLQVYCSVTATRVVRHNVGGGNLLSITERKTFCFYTSDGFGRSKLTTRTVTWASTSTLEPFARQRGLTSANNVCVGDTGP
jgi:hypothetical protein